MWCLSVAGTPQTQQTRAALSMLGLPIMGSRSSSTVQTSFDGFRGLGAAGLRFAARSARLARSLSRLSALIRARASAQRRQGHMSDAPRLVPWRRSSGSAMRPARCSALVFIATPPPPP